MPALASLTSEESMKRQSVLAGTFFLAVAVLPAVTQSGLRPTADIVRGHFITINRKVLEMAKDFPEDKYDFRLKPEMRSFRELIVHIAGGNIYAARAGRGSCPRSC